MKLTSTSNRDVGLIRALVHGDSGVGKTTSLRTLPANMTCIAAAERGLLPLRQMAYPVATIETWDDVRDLIRKCQQPEEVTKEFVSAKIAEKGFEFKCLAIDSLSQISELCKRQIVTVDRKLLQVDRAAMKKQESAAPLGIYDDLMALEDFNLYATRMIRMIDAITHLPVHIVITSLSGLVQDKKGTGAAKWRPALHGQAAITCPAYFDEIFRMEASEERNDNGELIQRRLWRTYGNDEVVAKDSSGVLDPFEVADWGNVFKKILNGKAVTK